MKIKELTQARLKELLTYDPETGSFVWNYPVVEGSRSRYANYIRLAGKEVGTVIHRGYRLVRIAGEAWLLHRLAFLYMTGNVPACVDHINRDTTDNRWVNLRAASQAENIRNQSLRSNNKTGVTGVTYEPGSSMRAPYVASITFNNKGIFLGNFPTLEEASQARWAAEKRLFGDYAPTEKYGVTI